MRTMPRRTLPAVAGLLLGIALGWTAAAQDPPEETKSVAEELRDLYEADQADRSFTSPPTAEQWKEISARDSARRDRVVELVKSGMLQSADDYYHAAMVLQHGEGPEPVLVAHILATVAGFKGHKSGRWLSAAALDRYLHRTGAAQMLGTQYVRSSSEEPWTQGEYDQWLPDPVRAEFGVPSLEKQKARTDELNAPRGGSEGR